MNDKGDFRTIQEIVRTVVANKDVCLLPSPEWTEVPRTKAKAKPCLSPRVFRPLGRMQSLSLSLLCYKNK